VRVALAALPRDLTSLKASAQAWLPSAGGPCGRNWAGPVMANGCSVAHCGSSASAYIGGVGCQAPGPVPGT
jgi:hypothetical protein